MLINILSDCKSLIDLKKMMIIKKFEKNLIRIINNNNKEES